MTSVVRHAAWAIARFLAKSDGATAYESLCGKEYQGDVLQLFEQLWRKEPSRAGAKL